MTDIRVEKLGYPQPVNVVDGTPLCPCHQEPMIAHGANEWVCSLYAPLLDHFAKASKVLDAVLEA